MAQGAQHQLQLGFPRIRAAQTKHHLAKPMELNKDRLSVSEKEIRPFLSALPSLRKTKYVSFSSDASIAIA